ncbi:BspA family leucine-rich repeat surface protein [Poritiphilus flavus]|uniref:BspA family leucine-rich repeat surface protein n=1 Tax=Poritiphilus flavus TaxID=2697053 RepID=A0A6L9EDW7_9FLAO|nr:BspA family leucine-rich repeat surface protein [Poritiphilus flavus]NAS12887.1 BspA family leucine-rich repeat surface protein [Poritiphilus flavus]
MRTKHFIGLKRPVLTLFTCLCTLGLSAQTEFITTWNTTITTTGSSDSNSITLPLTGTYDVDVGNDGTYDLFDQSGTITINITNYSDPATGSSYTAGQIQLAVRNATSGAGTLSRILLNNTADKEKILSVDQWGNIAWSRMDFAFTGCTNLDVKATDAPDLSAVTNMGSMFKGCSSLEGNPSFNTWNISNVQYMIRMFESASIFNQNIGNWNTSSVIDTGMQGMFLFATDFNQDIGNWNTSGCDDMRFMFTDAMAFNQDISNWDMSNVENTNYMFQSRVSGPNGPIKTAFDQDLGSWDLRKLTSATEMFEFSGISPANWDATIKGWNAQNFTNNVTIGADGLKYCDAQERNDLNSGSFKVDKDSQDTDPPTALCQQQLTLVLDANGQAALTTDLVDNGSKDACGSVSLSLSQSSFTVLDLGDNTITLTVTDNTSKTSTCTTAVTVEDNTNPVAACKDLTVQLDATGSITIATSDIDNSSSDNSGSISLSLDKTDFGCSDTGQNTVTLTAEDDAGNTDTCTATVTVQDTTDPTASCKLVTLPLGNNGTATLTTDLVDNSSADNCGIASLEVSRSSFTGSDLGDQTVTLTATDPSGNTKTCNTTVTVVDDTAPTASCKDTTVQLLSNSDFVEIFPAAVNDGSSDNVDNFLTFSLNKTIFSCSDSGQNTVTLTVTDDSNNTATCTATVTVEDIVPPTAVCQQATIELDANGAATLTGDLINGSSSDACGTISTLGVSRSNFTASDLGANTVTLTVTDNSGNTDNCETTVTVEDNIAPTAICKDITLELEASGSAKIIASDANNGSSDNSGTAVLLSLEEDTFNCSDVGQNSVTLTVEDGSGNTATCTSMVTVKDVTAPTAVCQAVTLELNQLGSANLAASSLDNGSSDGCGGNVTVEVDFFQRLFTGEDLGENTVTLTVYDESGNADTCEAIVTVVDNIAPTARCKDITVELDALTDSVTVTPAEVDNDSSDNSDVMFFSLDEGTFRCSDVGQNNVTLTVSDESNNSATCTATITVEDNIAPVALCRPATLTLLADGTSTTLDPSLVDNGSSTACGNVSLEVSPSSFSISDLGDNAVTLTVTDNHGNVSTCETTLTVVETTAPIAVCQDLSVQLDTTGGATITTAEVDNGSTDNSGTVFFSLDKTSFECSDLGPNTVTLTVTDGSNNTATCTSVVTVRDLIAPIALCQETTLELGLDGTAILDATLINNGSTDNCGISLSTFSETFTVADLGANDIILTVTDEGGNTSTCETIVTVVDNIAPTAICQDITVELDASGTVVIGTTNVDNGSSDNSGATVVLNLDTTSFGCSDLGQNTVILTASDGSNNTSTCSATVTVTPASIAVVTNNGPICQGSVMQLNETSGLAISWSWSSDGDAVFNDPGLQNPEVSNVTNGEVFSVTITLADGCPGIGTAVASVLEVPVLEAENQQGFCPSGNFTVSDLVASGNGTIRWYPGENSNMEFESDFPLSDGAVYYGSLEDGNGCFSERVAVSVSLALDNCGSLQDLVKRGFSPNGDGINDTFSISWVKKDYPNFIITVYDRNGSLVYKGDVDTPDWDGSAGHGVTLGDAKLPSGVYYYTIDFGDGSTPSFQGIVYLDQ